MRKIIAAMIIGIVAVVTMQFYFWNKKTIYSENGVTYELKPGTSKYHLLSDLHHQGILSHPLFYMLYILPVHNQKLIAGEYRFPKHASFRSIWKEVTTGQGQIYHSFMIVPGWTFSEVRQSLQKADWAVHITQAWSDDQLMKAMGYPNVKAEGQFFPETYFYTKGVSDLIVLKRAFLMMQKKLTLAWDKRSTALPYQTPYQALIAASLIEKEAYLKTERPIIAGVLVNRLRKNMLLQFDPTIIYGMGTRYQGKIYKYDLHEDSPYNTYLHKGLPPTPIAMPSLSSIEAALHPEQHDYYYFVAKGNGAHQFSKSLNEHNAAVKAVKPQAYFNEDKINYLLQRQLIIAKRD